MELDDCAFPLLADVVMTDDAEVAFGDADYALLVGAMPRKAGMERSDLLSANGGIFRPQGKALNSGAQARRQGPRRRQPGQHQRPDRPAQRPGPRPRAVHRHDPARPQPRREPAGARSSACPSTDVTKMTIWGNHSTTQYPDLFHAEVGGKSAYELVGDHDWVDGTFIPTVAKRGAAIIEARGASSAASAANAAIDHMRTWALGTADGDWVVDGGPVGRLLRRGRGDHLVVPVHLLGRRVPDRPGPRHRRLLARQDRRLRGRAGRGARRRSRSSTCCRSRGSASVRAWRRGRPGPSSRRRPASAPRR